jgi:membrane protein
MGVKDTLGIFKRAGKEFLEDECMMRAAALSYYTVFSLPPLLVLIMLVLGAVLDPETVQRTLEGQISGLMGSAGSEQVRTIFEQADPPGGALLPTLLGIAALAFGATLSFAQLQDAMNKAWNVEPDPKAGGIKGFIMKRLFSLGMIMGLAFLLLVSLALTAAISAFGEVISGRLGGISEGLLYAINLVVTFAIITGLFGAMFRILPDAEIEWGDVWAGALLTTLLFLVGKFAIGFYLGQTNPGEAYGAAGSLATIFIWIYYSSMIILFGAEFTQAWTERHSGERKAEDGAMKVEEHKVEIRE